MTQKTKERFDDLIGKAMLYQKEVITFTKWTEFASGTIVLIGDLKNVNIQPNEIEKFLNEVKPIDPLNMPVAKEELKENQLPKTKMIRINDITVKEEKIMITEKPAENSEAAQSTEPSEAVIYNPVSESEILKESLLEMLKKVKNDKSYIPQAAAMVNITNAIVNVQKNQINALQVMNKLNPAADANPKQKLLANNNS